MRKFHHLTVGELHNETADSVRLALDVPRELQSEYSFLPGQHLPVQVEIDGKLIRRTYSICSVPGEWPLEIGVRIQPGGLFSEFVAGQLKVGDRLDVMPPIGQFHATVAPQTARTYLAFAAGSGITPILSILRATLEREPESRFLLFYANRKQNTTMFIEELQALKNRFTERLQLHFLFTRENQEFPIFSGRLDSKKTTELYRTFCCGLKPDEAFVCGPDTMLDSVRDALLTEGMDTSDIHVERYGAPRTAPSRATPEEKEGDPACNVTVIMDGHVKTFAMSPDAGNIVDGAAIAGIELPFSCKGGVCATCRTHVQVGKVRMNTNYGLESWEVEKGYVLACQSLPLTETVTLDYDKT